MNDWAGFFKDHEDYVIRVGFYENHRNFTMEELYQAFKARLEHEQHGGDGDS